MTPQEFPKGKEEYCPRCYFEDEVTILREDCPHRTTKQDKYQKIMEVMSDKTLSFGCRIYTKDKDYEGRPIATVIKPIL